MFVCRGGNGRENKYRESNVGGGFRMMMMMMVMMMARALPVDPLVTWLLSHGRTG
jgi:hypothetical protein